MRLPELQRQVVCGLLGATGFLVLYLLGGLIWWLALVLGVLIYAAALFLIGTRPALEDVQLANRVSAADVMAAASALGEGARRMEAAAEDVSDKDRESFLHLARGLRSIQKNVEDDPESYRVARRFVNVFLPSIVSTVEGYVGLSGRTGPKMQGRLEKLREQIGGFTEIIDRVNRACVERDLQQLEVEASTIEDLMKRL